MLTVSDEKILKLIGTAARMVETASSKSDWEDIYDNVFGMRIWQKMRKQGYSFDWYDPDTTYEADVRAYVEALVEWRDETFKEQVMADGTLVKIGDEVSFYVTFCHGEFSFLKPTPKRGLVTLGFIDGFALYNCYGTVEAAGKAFQKQIRENVK